MERGPLSKQHRLLDWERLEQEQGWEESREQTFAFTPHSWEVREGPKSSMA